MKKIISLICALMVVSGTYHGDGEFDTFFTLVGP